MNKVYLLTGGNMGNRAANLLEARMTIALTIGEVLAASSLYETSAWGNIPQPDYLNQVLLVQTHLPATDLLKATMQVEKKMGRERTVKYGPRVIDIDILFFNNDIIETPTLTVPHPFLHERRFTLIPLAEIAAGYEHPVLHQSVAALLTACTDALNVKKFSA